jgi:hypothetical protein
MYGPRSYSWSITIDDHDIYVAAWKLRKQSKFSLHESGQWHLKYIEDGRISRPQLTSYEQAGQSETRSTGLCIVIPDACLRAASQHWRQTPVNIWLDRPEPDGFVELVVGRVTGPATYDDVPRLQAMGFRLWHTSMGGGWYAYFGQRAVGATEPAGREYQSHLDWIKARLPEPVLLNSPERRLVVAMNTRQGHLGAMEVAID